MSKRPSVIAFSCLLSGETLVLYVFWHMFRLSFRCCSRAPADRLRRRVGGGQRHLRGPQRQPRLRRQRRQSEQWRHRTGMMGRQRRQSEQGRHGTGMTGRQRRQSEQWRHGTGMWRYRTVTLRFVRQMADVMGIKTSHGHMCMTS